MRLSSDGCGRDRSAAARGGDMAEGTADNPLAKIFGPVLGGLIGSFLTWLMTGWPGWLSGAILGLGALGGAVCGVVFSLIYQRYLGVLASGGEPEGSDERKAYDRLRESLTTENLAARLYTRWLTKSLDKVDRFFGDAGMADHTLFPHAFGLQTPAPLWTAASFDRCLLLALVYPIAIIFLIWTVSGHVGPTEAALQLTPGMPVWRRLLSFLSALVTIIVLTRSKFGPEFTSLEFTSKDIELSAWQAVFGMTMFAFAHDIGGAGPSYIVLAAGLSFFFGATTHYGFIAIASTSSVVIGFPIIAANEDYYAFIFILITLGFVSILTSALWTIVRESSLWGPYYLVLFAALIACIFASAPILSSHDIWSTTGPLLFFIVLLAALNAPFDWASLGLTRALLRRGLERGGLWPFVYGLIDAALAAAIITALALTMVLGVQIFDELAAHYGGDAKRILPLVEFFDGIAAKPGEAKYWWVYALLLSTMFPSLLNLMIGGASLARGLPFVAQLVLPFLPAGRAVPAFDRAWIAWLLALQSVGGAVLGLLAQVLLAVGILVFLMPWLGLNLLEMARGLAALDIPGQTGRFVVGLF